VVGSSGLLGENSHRGGSRHPPVWARSAVRRSARRGWAWRSSARCAGSRSSTTSRSAWGAASGCRACCAA